MSLLYKKHLPKVSMSLTIKDVALKSGVSIATVSHVINNTRYVSEQTRSRVEKVIKDIGYNPNLMARSLRGGETATIGLIIPDNSNPFFAEISRKIEDIGFQNGYSVILCNSDGDIARETKYINLLISKQIDGLIFIASQSTQEQLEELKRRRIPIVLVDRDVSIFLGDIVLVDNENGGYAATKYLLNIGHNKIACISGPSYITPSADRIKGYQIALKEFGVGFRDEYLVTGDFGYRSGEIALEKLLELQDRPTAIFSCNDMMAFGVMKAAKNKNVQIPEDFSLIGFDDIQFASIMTPALSTVAQPINEIASTAMSILLKKMHNNTSDYIGGRVVLNPKLIIRDTCMSLSR